MRVAMWLPVCLAIGEASVCAEMIGPRWMAENAVFHHACETDPTQADVMAEGLALSVDGPVAQAADGLLGAAALTEAGGGLRLHGAAVSPHRPLTLSFWWALPRDLQLDGGFSLFSMTGKGYVGWFVRGRGEWCALQRPAGVFQVYYFDGIQDVNGIYDYDLMGTLDLTAGVWHHSAVVFKPGGRVRAYCDGRLVFDHTTSGRAFQPEDELTTLTLGGGVLLDEIIIMGRAVDGEMLRDYERGVRRIREYLGQTLDEHAGSSGRQANNGFCRKPSLIGWGADGLGPVGEPPHRRQAVRAPLKSGLQRAPSGRLLVF